jgi:transcriptional regulator with XRE-family HTH domain
MALLNEQDVINAFGAKVRELRKNRNMSMQSLANIAEIELSQIYRIEKGIINPKLTTIVAIARALNLTQVELVNILRPDA